MYYIFPRFYCLPKALSVRPGSLFVEKEEFKKEIGGVKNILVPNGDFPSCNQMEK